LLSQTLVRNRLYIWLLLSFLFSFVLVGESYAAQWRHNNHSYEQCFVNTVSRSKFDLGVGSYNPWIVIDRISHRKNLPPGHAFSQSAYDLSFDIHQLGDLVRSSDNLQVVADVLGQDFPKDPIVLRVSLDHSQHFQQNLITIEGRDYFYPVRETTPKRLYDQWHSALQPEISAFHWVTNRLPVLSPMVDREKLSIVVSEMDSILDLKDIKLSSLRDYIANVTDQAFTYLTDSDNSWAYIDHWISPLGVRIDPYGNLIEVSEHSSYSDFDAWLRQLSDNKLLVFQNLHDLIEKDQIFVDDAGWLRSKRVPPVLNVKELDAHATRYKRVISPSRYILKGVPDTKLTKFQGYPVVTLPHFMDRSTISRFHEILTHLKQSGDNNIIIRLDNNYGGRVDLMMEAVAGFISSNESPLTISQNIGVEDIELKKDISQIFDPDSGIHIVMIVNAQTASAAEIFASILRYYYGDKVTIIGVDPATAGKGTVTDESPPFNNRVFRYEYGILKTPDGRTVERVGLPLIRVPKEYLEDYSGIEAALRYGADICRKRDTANNDTSE